MVLKKKSISINKIFRIAKAEFTKWVLNPRMIVILVMILFVRECAIQPLLEHCTKMSSNINVLEPFIAIGNSNMLMLIIPAVFLTLMSDFPRTDGNSLFYIIRCGKMNWLFGQVLFGIMSLLSFLGITFLFTIIFGIGNVFLGNGWSNVITKYNMLYPNDSASFASELIRGRIYNQMTPVEAFLHTFLLLSGYLLVILLILIVFFLISHKAIGIFANSIIMTIGAACTFLETNVMWIMPTANALIGLHYTEIYSKPIMPVYESYLYFGIIICVLFIICIKLIIKYNISDIKDVD